ncbi:hypothetical protein B0H12DRAFT_1066353 [Mycena haematopus]|nr:hypothetical protein B0H12DRAFT_1066353 [Mycena haematopus]
MFHQSYPSVSSYRTPTSPMNPREKYLAALAEAKAAEAEYLAAEQLQQEENQLRQRLEQIQRLKNQPSAYYTHTPAPPYPQTASLDLEALRHQIVAEERARIIREQEIEALRAQEARRKARELETLRIHEARKAQLAARDIERSRALAAQRAELEALTHRAIVPSVRFVVSEDANDSRPRHVRPAIITVRLLRGPDTGITPKGRSYHRATNPELPNTVEIPLLAATAKPHHARDCGCEGKPRKVRVAPISLKPTHETNYKSTQETKTTDVNVEDLLSRLFGARRPKPEEAQARPVSLEQLLQQVLGSQTAPQPKTDTKPAEEAAPQRQAEIPITLEKLLSHFLGATGNDVQQSQASTSDAASAPAEKKEVPPAPAPPQSAPASKPDPAPTASAAQAPQPIGLQDVLNHFLGAASSTGAPSQSTQGGVQVDLQQLLNMFLGGAAPAPAQPQVRKFMRLIPRRAGPNVIPIFKAGSSNSASASTTSDSKPAMKKTEREEREERELEEAIRLSLADSSPPTSESKGKAPAPAPVKDVASSTAEVHAIDASFTTLANEFVFPPQLDFSTSRTASPTRNTTAEESVIAKLSYSTQNQPVRFYHQALIGLLTRLDAVDSFGDEGLRHERKEVVGRVEGAMDEVERVVEGRWRKWAGRERVVESTTSSADAVVASEDTDTDVPAALVDSQPVPVPESILESSSPSPAIPAEASPTNAVVASEVTDVPAASVDSEPVPAPESVQESIPESASLSPAIPADATQPDSSSYPPSSEPASAAESVATLRPSSPIPSSPAPLDAVASPTPSAIDTFLLPSSSAEPVIQKKPRASDSDTDVDVGSDWSEVDA